jgi:hypothetical protein
MEAKRSLQPDASVDVLDIVEKLSSEQIGRRMQALMADYSALKTLYRAALARERALPAVEDDVAN